MFINIIAGLNIVAELAFIGMLLFCCYRTRSKGVILLSATTSSYQWDFQLNFCTLF